MALATISLAAHRGTMTRRAMRSGDVGEKGAEAGMVSPLDHPIHVLQTPFVSLGFTWYVLQIMMLQSLLRVKETEVLVIPVLLRLQETLIAATSTQLLLFGTTAARRSSLKETRRSQQSHKYP